MRRNTRRMSFATEKLPSRHSIMFSSSVEIVKQGEEEEDIAEQMLRLMGTVDKAGLCSVNSVLLCYK